MSSHPQFQAPETSELCELLPAYDVTTFIAKGGMGAVYRASQKSLDRDVAIKILPREFGEDEEFRKRFEAEAKAMAKLNHPNLIGVYDFGEVDDMPYIVMEYVDGKSLHHSAHGKAIDQQEACRLALGICEGLAHAHEADILHRDIKPANILLDPKKNAKIGDFGLARAEHADDSDELVFGTPGYTAPEVMKDASSVGKRSDVFSTGVILYELLTGELPGEKYVPASQMKKVDPRFDRIIRRATHPSPTLRFADGAAMASELKTLLEALNKPGASIVTAATVTEKNPDADAASPAAASPETGPTDTPAPVVAAPQGNSWGLLRNMIIIVILLVAIWGMWGAYKAKVASNERKRKEHEEELQKQRQAAAAKAEADRIAERKRQELLAAQNNNSGNPDTGTNTPPPPPKVETPMETLERLKSQLANSDRSEFPKGTEERGDNRFFFVDSPMNWQDAAAFAEEHGGHLATCPTEPDSNWLSSKIPNNATVWLGGGAIGRNDWGWFDGSEWKHRKASVSTGTSAALTALGTLKARPPGELMPFFIQWNMDGRNLGSINSNSPAPANPSIPLTPSTPRAPSPSIAAATSSSPGSSAGTTPTTWLNSPKDTSLYPPIKPKPISSRNSSTTPSPPAVPSGSADNTTAGTGAGPPVKP